MLNEEQLEIVGCQPCRLHRSMADLVPMVEHRLPLGIVAPRNLLETGRYKRSAMFPSCSRVSDHYDCAVR